MSRKLTRKTSSRKDSSARQPIISRNVQPGNIVWLPLSAMEKSHLIRRFEYNHKVPSIVNDQALPPEAYNHPVVVLDIMNLPSRHSNQDDYVIVANLTSFGNTTGCEDTGLLHTRDATVWDSYRAIYPSAHPSNKDVLHLQKGRLDKSSYVHLVRIYVPLSALKTFTRGPTATAPDIHLTSASLGILLREVEIKTPQFGDRGPPGVGRATTAIPPSPSLPVLSTQARLLTPRSMPYHPQIVVPKDILGGSEPGPTSRRGARVMPSSPLLAMRTFPDTVSAPHTIPSRPPISAREDTLLITNTQRLSQPISLHYTRDNYGSIETWSLPPPITWNPRGRTSTISRISNSISRERVLLYLKVALCLWILGLIVFYTPWASIGSIFTKIGHSLRSIWSSCWSFVANGWGSFITFFCNSWHTFVAWLKSLAWK